MATRWFALFTGFFYAGFGLMGFMPRYRWSPEMPQLRMNLIFVHGGWLGGFIPVNWPHNILWIVMGVGGIVAFASYFSSKFYAQGIFALTTALAIIGFMPLGIATMWGLLPLTAWNIPIHATTAVLAWYYGCVYTYGRELRVAA